MADAARREGYPAGRSSIALPTPRSTASFRPCCAGVGHGVVLVEANQPRGSGDSARTHLGRAAVGPRRSRATSRSRRRRRAALATPSRPTSSSAMSQSSPRGLSLRARSACAREDSRTGVPRTAARLPSQQRLLRRRVRDGVLHDDLRTDHMALSVLAAYRAALVEAGHLCQTFCLTATWLGPRPVLRDGLWPIRSIERDLGIDGIRESVLYAAGVGRPPAGSGWAPLPRGTLKVRRTAGCRDSDPVSIPTVPLARPRRSIYGPALLSRCRQQHRRRTGVGLQAPPRPRPVAGCGPYLAVPSRHPVKLLEGSQNEVAIPRVQYRNGPRGLRQLRFSMPAGMPDPAHHLNRDRTRGVRLSDYKRFLMHTALLIGRVSQMMRATSLNRQAGARRTRTTVEPSLMMSLARTSGSRRKTRCCDSRMPT